jgi:Tfp pilus assembly protein PilF
LREHELRFPNGELTAERLFLTAQAHARAGNESAARHYAKLLATRFPKSTYLPRVRPLLDPAPGTPAR